MAYLAPSLRRLFNEIDAVWPNRDRRTDGWLRWPKDGKSVGHNPDGKGCVHAIDVDRDGIWPEGIIMNIRKQGSGLRYIIWNRKIWHARTNWEHRPYTLSNPHTDHLHIEIDQTYSAENYAGGWNLGALIGGGILGGLVPGGGGSGGTQGIGAANDRDYTAEMAGIMLRHKDAAVSLGNARNHFRGTRSM